MKSIFFIAVSALLIVMSSCGKDKAVINHSKWTSNPGVKQKSTYRDFASWRAALKVPKQKFRLDASRGGTVRGNRGYQFTVKPGTLLDENNKPITGMVDVELTEATSADVMMATGAGTWAEDGLLCSVGMFNLNITQSGKSVSVNPNQPIQAMVTADENVNMQGVQLFSGNTDDSSFNDSVVRWRPIRDTTRFNYDSLRMVWDSIQKAFIKKRCIRFNLNFLSWCNLDKYIDNPNGEKIEVHIPGIQTNLDTRVYMYLNQDYLKGLFQMFDNGLNTDLKRVFNSSNYKLPLGWKIRVIVVTRDKDYNLFYESRIITNTAGAVHEFKDLKPISDLDLEDFFKSL